MGIGLQPLQPKPRLSILRTTPTSTWAEFGTSRSELEFRSWYLGYWS